MTSRLFILLCILSALGSTVIDATAQTLQERVELADALNDYVLLLGTQSFPFDYPESQVVGIGNGEYGSIELRGLDGTCGAPYDDEIILSRIPESEIMVNPRYTIRFRMRTRDGAGTVDIVEDAHPFVCDLNSWLGFNLRNVWNYGLRDTGNAKLKYNAACGSGADAEFFTVYEDASGCTFGLGPSDSWTINPWSLWRRYYAMVRENGIDYTSADFWSPRLCIGSDIEPDAIFPSEGSYDVFIGRRNQEWTDWLGTTHNNSTELHRAHSVLQFDYRYYNYNGATHVSAPDADSDDPGNYGNYTDSSYVLPWLDDPANKPRLDSIVYIARMHQYSTPATPCTGCAPPAFLAPETDKASITVRVYFTENVPSATACSSYVAEFRKEYTDPDPQVNNERLWTNDKVDEVELFSFDWIRGNWLEFRMDAEGNVYLWLNTNASQSGATVSSGSGCTVPSTSERKLYITKVRTKNIPEEFCDIMLPAGYGTQPGGLFGAEDVGLFHVDEATGDLLYTYGDGSGEHTTRIHCLDFCEPITSDATIANVISAGAQTFSDRWEYDPEAHGSWAQTTGNSPYSGHAANDVERGQIGKWRTEGSWTYRSNIKPASDDPALLDDGRIYEDAGVFVDQFGNSNTAFKLFDWVKGPGAPSVEGPSWLNPTTVTRYAPSGEPVEELNILGIYSAAKLAHNNTVPLLVAQNAQYDVVDFESFEEYVVNEPTTPATDDFAHSGRTSYKLKDNPSDVLDPLLTMRVTQQLTGLPGVPYDPNDPDGLLIKFWVKRTYANPGLPFPPVKVHIEGVNESGGSVNVLSGPQIFDLEASGPDYTSETQRLYKVAQTGEWSLYQLHVNNFDHAKIGTKFTVKIAKHPTIGSDQVWIDDLRGQPIDAQMGCYVYDRKNLRLLAQFDDQHFGLFYQYNGEGKLVRKLRETERGLKTVAETQYHTPLSGDRVFADGLEGPPIDPPEVFSSYMDPSLRGGMGTSSGNTFDLFNLRLGRDGVKTMLLGDSTLNLRSAKERALSRIDLSSLDQKALGAFAADVPEIERLGLLKELVELEAEREELADRAATEASESSKRELQERLHQIDARKDEILKEKLGLTEAEIRSLYDQLRKESEEHDEEPVEETDESE